MNSPGTRCWPMAVTHGECRCAGRYRQPGPSGTGRIPTGCFAFRATSRRCAVARSTARPQPVVSRRTAAVIHVDGGGCFAPMAQAVGLPALAEAAAEVGRCCALAHQYPPFRSTVARDGVPRRPRSGGHCLHRVYADGGAGRIESRNSLAPTRFPLPGHVRENHLSATTWPRQRWQWGMCRSPRGMAKPCLLGTGLDADGNETTDPAKIVDGVSCCPLAATRDRPSR